MIKEGSGTKAVSKLLLDVLSEKMTLRPQTYHHVVCRRLRRPFHHLYVTIVGTPVSVLHLIYRPTTGMKSLVTMEALSKTTKTTTLVSKRQRLCYQLPHVIYKTNPKVHQLKRYRTQVAIPGIMRPTTGMKSSETMAALSKSTTLVYKRHRLHYHLPHAIYKTNLKAYHLKRYRPRVATPGKIRLTTGMNSSETTVALSKATTLVYKRQRLYHHLPQRQRLYHHLPRAIYKTNLKAYHLKRYQPRVAIPGKIRPTHAQNLRWRR